MQLNMNYEFTEKLGLIPKTEVNDSDITPEAAEEFIRLPKKETDSLGYGSLDLGNGSTMDLVKHFAINVLISKFLNHR